VEGTRQLAESWKRRYSHQSASEMSDEDESSEWSCERDDAEDEDGSSTATEGDALARELLLRQNERLLERAKRRREEDSEVGVASEGCSGQGGFFFEATGVSVCETRYFDAAAPSTSDGQVECPPRIPETAKRQLEPLRMPKAKEKSPRPLDSDEEFQLACLDEGEILELDEFLNALDSPNVDSQMSLKPSELFPSSSQKYTPKKNKYLSREFRGDEAVGAITRGVRKAAISPPKKKDSADNCRIM